MALGRRSRTQATTQWLDSARAQLEQQLAKEQAETGQLLELPFVDWCQTLKIKTDKGLQPFELFPWQADFSDLIVGDKALTRRAIALLSSRQTGKTSLNLALMAYLAQSRRQFSGLVLHRTTQDAYLLCRRLKTFLDGARLKSDSLSLLEFADSGSQIHFRSCAPNKPDGASSAARGLPSIDFCIVDEFSHTANARDIVTVVAPTTTWSNMGLLVLIGTASSKQTYFYEQLSSAADGADSLESLLESVREENVAPYQVLDRGEGAVGVVTNWRAIGRFKSEPDFLKRIQGEFDLSDEQIDGEYELKFDSNQQFSVFSPESVINAQTDDIQQSSDVSGVIHWGVDSAGAGADFAVAIGLRELLEESGGFEVCAMYRKRTGTMAEHIGAIANMMREYGAQSATVETNNMGQAWLEELSLIVDAFNGMSGFATTGASKPSLIGSLSIALQNGHIRIPTGSKIIKELLAFQRDERGRMGAPNGKHDDCVMALALALHSAGYHLRSKQRESFEPIAQAPKPQPEPQTANNFRRPNRRWPIR